MFLREYYYTDTAMRISAIRIELMDQNVGEMSENENPEASRGRVIITRDA